MKNILKYTAAAVALVTSLAACQEFEDLTETVQATPKMAYVDTGSGNTFSARIMHRPTGSVGSFSTEFAVRSNSPVHAEATVTIAHDASLVETYNAEHETQYAALPAEYLVLENATLTLPENAVQSEETVKVSLSTEADLSALTERYYLAPLRLQTTGIGASEALGVVWLLVETEINLIRPITSIADMVGFPADGSLWTADCGSYANLFDGNTATSVAFQSSNVLTIDMKEETMVTGLKLNTFQFSSLSIEYSLDGKEWSQAGTPSAEEYIWGGSSWSAGDFVTAVYDYFEARYLRLSFGFSGNNRSINEIEVYQIESTDPTIYALTGANNVVTGKIVHKKGVGSSCDLNAAFKVYTTISSPGGYAVTAAADNSLVEAYNRTHGTSYAVLPQANLSIENASITIAGGENASAAEVKISLTGDLSGLNEKEGYLIPVKLSAQSGAVVSESRGVVYAIVSVENNLIRAITSVDDMIGFPAGGSSSWTADCGDAGNLFDGNNATSVSGLSSSGNTITVDMKSARMVTGLHFYTYNLAGLAIEYSADGDAWETAGTVAAGENVFTGSSYRAGDYYMAFADYLDARYLRLSFNFATSYYTSLYEMEVYEIESTDPTIYAQCGADNVLTGSITHHSVAGPIAGVNAAFNVMTTIASASGYQVGVETDNSLIAAYNAKNGTSYAAIDPSLVKIEGVPVAIAAGANKSADQVRVSLDGNLSTLTNTNGYLIPLQLKAPSGAVVSASRGVVYIAVSVSTSSDPFRTNFTAGDIAGTQVADRSAWTILACDQEGVHSGSYAELFDGKTDTYVRTWGGPLSFTVDLGKEYDLTGMVFTSRSDYQAQYAPSSVMIEYSLDGTEYQELGTPSQTAGSVLRELPYGYVSLYAPLKVRYLRLVVDYGGSNMGTAEFNIYAN